ncbi:MAG TPA: lantibiotic dehydratase, partial [Pseudonocardiaceae bacterium]
MSSRPASHRVPLGRTGWSVWRDVLVRSTGFPADGMNLFTAPDCARAADALLAAPHDDVAAKEFDEELARATAAGARHAADLAADPLFREAVAWQGTSVPDTMDALVRAADGPRTSRQRAREALVARYWQRYSAKNETVGFFGPGCWARVDPDAAHATVTPGQGLVRERRVYLEHWALTALAHVLAGDERVRRWLPPSLPPHLTLD